MMRPSLIALLALLLGGACHTASRSPTPVSSVVASGRDAFDLVGTIRDEATGRPLAGVLIVVDSLSTVRATTDADGRYRISDLPLGSYVISARKLGFYVERRDVEVSCPVVIVDSTGRPVGGRRACDPDGQVLNFHMRPRVIW